MPKLNRIDRALLPIEARWNKQEKAAKKAEATQPKVGEVMFDRKRDARRAFAETWANMSPEQRDAELVMPGRANEIASLMFPGAGAQE